MEKKEKFVASFGPITFRGVEFRSYYASNRAVYLSPVYSTREQQRGWHGSLQVEFKAKKPVSYKASLSGCGTTVGFTPTGPDASAYAALYGARKCLRSLLAELDAPVELSPEEAEVQYDVDRLPSGSDGPLCRKCEKSWADHQNPGASHAFEEL